jgi:hypothetical protein
MIEKIDWNEIRKNLEEHKDTVMEVVINLSKFILRQRSEKNLQLAQDFLDSARQNLEGYFFHYEKKNFSQGIFNLTLASEKLVKTYALAIGVIKKEELRKKVAHKSPLVYQITVEKEPFKSLFSFINLLNPKFTSNINLKDIISNKNFQLEMLRAREEDIKKFLDKCNNQNVYIKNLFIFFGLSPRYDSFLEECRVSNIFFMEV